MAVSRFSPVSQTSRMSRVDDRAAPSEPFSSKFTCMAGSGFLTVKIRKAVITAAGRDQRRLPLQSLVDRDGQSKSALTILLEEVLHAGIEEIGLVIAPGDQAAFAAAAGPHVNRIQFIEQSKPLGYGHAVLCAHPCVAQMERSAGVPPAAARIAK
jgi:hypothetical protein